MSHELDYEEVVENAFDEYIEDYELDSEGSINDMLYELFLAGFEAAMDLMDDDEEDE
jgi:hypothetical protein